ncbi:MAG: hypothetical protein A2142_06695 [candidate division Zixibacteria bacterium RBG_16_48_11]|nr:MAG: hypothetical protein A2142_06695 [candidate division Zixibacteria bacterium RBG_16_48_11]
MENKRFVWLLSLMALSLVVSLIGLLTIMSRLPVSGKKMKTGPSADVSQTSPHLYTSTTKGGTVIARIGDKKITKPELLEQFGSLPPQMAVPFATKADTINFLNQYLGLELIYQQALNQGLGADSAVLFQVQEAKKQLMIDKYLATNLAIYQLPPSEEDINAFYQANKARLGNRSLVDVRAEIGAILSRQQQRVAYQNLVDQLWQSKEVEVYEESL